MVSQLVRCYGVLYYFTNLFYKTLLFLFAIELALFVEFFACADMAEIHVFWRNVRNSIVVIDEAEGVSFEIVVEFFSEILVTHTRLTIGVESVYILAFLLA